MTTGEALTIIKDDLKNIVGQKFKDSGVDPALGILILKSICSDLADLALENCLPQQLMMEEKIREQQAKEEVEKEGDKEKGDDALNG